MYGKEDQVSGIGIAGLTDSELSSDDSNKSNKLRSLPSIDAHVSPGKPNKLFSDTTSEGSPGSLRDTSSSSKSKFLQAKAMVIPKNTGTDYYISIFAPEAPKDLPVRAKTKASIPTVARGTVNTGPKTAPTGHLRKNSAPANLPSPSDLQQAQPINEAGIDSKQLLPKLPIK